MIFEYIYSKLKYVEDLSCKHTKHQAEHQATDLHWVYGATCLATWNGSGNHFGASQCISMDLAAATTTAAATHAAAATAAWCVHALKQSNLINSYIFKDKS